MANRYDPFRDVDRWLTNALRQVPSSPGMPLDLYREGESFVAKVDLPGVDPSTIDIDVEERTLTIRAERRKEQGEDVQWLSHERPTGTFARQLALGSGLALDRIEAGYADGVLTLTIPVAEEARPRKIQVSHTGTPTAIEQPAEA
ncbi:Hsp20/alpha crystallin family protein [Georgenia yuyongxinii]|uniref:Hsp20/alpha crystallin family protein n=1 Tax=Georgenia yuyongxinii TaxID=2589797 RepID=A0A552WMZ5_9MICO|nr:Hsp20/alpha crystallin family protein [Georgenia yuyongxinii]TRW44074.1 Hsp20/alpha crystallin family protein [Georgenia yuyongxinii]